MTSDSWGNAETQRQIVVELERIGAEILRDGFASEVPITLEQLLRAFRATPTGAGAAAFYATLRQILESK
jgi:hypothetical protein